MSEQVSIDDLINRTELLKYIGEFLLHGTVSGFDAEKHWAATKLLSELFDGVRRAVESHPDYPARVAAAQQKAADAKASE